MAEAVIVSAVRTPIGRANKGVLKDVRSDDLAAIAVKAALERVPNLDRSLIEDVIIGCAFPEGEQGMNLARLVGALAGIPETAGGVPAPCQASRGRESGFALSSNRAGVRLLELYPYGPNRGESCA